MKFNVVVERTIVCFVKVVVEADDTHNARNKAIEMVSKMGQSDDLFEDIIQDICDISSVEEIKE